LEGSISDEFGIEAAIIGVIDFFGHEAVEGGADGYAGLVEIKSYGCGEGVRENEHVEHCSVVVVVYFGLDFT
jgi:hypothetical protein